MNKSLLIALGLGLLAPFSMAAPKKAATDATPAVETTDKPKASKTDPKAAAKTPAPKAETKPAAKPEAPKAEKKPAKKTLDKPGELSESDKELVASAKKKSATLTAAQRTKLLDLANKGDAKSLQEIDGVGETKAKAIIKDRPFTNVEDIIMVDGVGEGTFDKILTFAKGDQKEASAKPVEKKPAPKADKKMEEAKPKKKAA